MVVYLKRLFYTTIICGILLIFLSLPVILSFGRVKTNLLVILLKSSQVLTGLREFSLFHTLSNIAVDKSPLGVHQVELVVEPGPGLGDSRGVGQHAHSTGNLGLVTSRYDSGKLVVDSNLESSGTPGNKLDASLGTCFPPPVSEKKVWKLSSPKVLSDGI